MIDKETRLLDEKYLQEAWVFFKNNDDAGAIEPLQKAYECGNIQAALLLADSYRNGEGVEKDVPKAMEIYHEVANQMNIVDHNEISMAQYNLFISYKNGEGVEKDMNKAIEWLIKSADNGCDTAQRLYGAMLMTGIPEVEIDLKKAEHYLILAAVNSNNVDAQINLIYLYCKEGMINESKNIAKMIYWLINAIDKGRDDMSDMLSRMLKILGNEAPSSAEMKAAIHEDVVMATNEKFDMYRRQIRETYGDISDEAVEDFLERYWSIIDNDDSDEATDEDDEVSDVDEFDDEDNEDADNFDDEESRLIREGYTLMEKDGDYEGAFKKWKQAYDMGSVTVAYNLAQCYDTAQGVDHDAKRGFELFMEVATSPEVDDKIRANAQNRVANGYFNGNGVKRDYDKAFEWYTKSADNGNVVSQYNMALSYYNGNHLKQDFNKAYHYAALSAQNEHIQSYTILGALYISGLGVEQNTMLGKNCLKIAASKGDRSAQALLDQLGGDDEDAD